MNTRIAIASDHAGVEYKSKLISHLKEGGYEAMDLGTYTEESVDYPVYADLVCRKLTAGEADLGILICGTGIGMSIAANKHRGIRAALCSDAESARLTRSHNDANVLCLGARMLPYDTILCIVDAFLSTPFSGGRHQRRVEMLEKFSDLS